MPSLSNEVKEKLQNALEYLQRSPGASTQSVAKRYGISKTTLRRYLNDPGRISKVTPTGGYNKILSEAQEQAIIDYIYRQFNFGFPATPAMVKAVLLQSIAFSGKESPSDRWLASWLHDQGDKINLQLSKLMD